MKIALQVKHQFMVDLLWLRLESGLMAQRLAHQAKDSGEEFWRDVGRYEKVVL